MISLKKGWGTAYEYLSEDDSRLYDRAAKGQIEQEEANRIIVELISRIQSDCRGDHVASKY
jgi:polyhydroxyalkanoate synthesis regulator phasin